MLLIVAHHYVVNSGLYDVIRDTPHAASAYVMWLFGAWGKTGINCFVLITGYFMCKSQFSGAKLLKLYLQITFYSLIIYGIFCISGHEAPSPFKAAWILFPIKSLNDGFVSCFLVFYLLIPFLNILIGNMDKKQHRLLLVILLAAYTCLPSIPKFNMAFNYVTWFSVLYILASYIRIYGLFPNVSHRGWGSISVLCLVLSSCSVLGLEAIYRYGLTGSHAPYFFVADSNKIMALALSVASFMFFKDLKIPHSRIINAVGASTFGVLLIHANSDAMRQWLWRETVDCIGHFGPSVLWTLSYATVSVLLIFTICAGIDWFRGRFIEKRLLGYITNILRKSKLYPC